MGERAGGRKIGEANEGREGIEAFEATSAVEKVALGMQETAGVEAHLHVFLAQKGDEVFDQTQSLFIKVFAGKVTDEAFDGFCVCFAQAEIEARFRFVTEQQAEVAKSVEAVAQQLPAADVEVGGGDVERVAAV